MYNGGRDITAVQIAYTLGGTDQQYRPIQAVVTPTATSVIVREQFVSTRSYLFHISANNSVGISNIVTCGPVLIKEGVCRFLETNTHKISLNLTGIPVRPDEPQIISTKPGTITMTLSTAASGAGATGSFAFIISSVPSIDKMQSTYSYPEYIDGQKVSIVINNLRGDISYYFTVSARNVYGTSPPQSTIWLSNSENIIVQCAHFLFGLYSTLQIQQQYQYHQYQVTERMCMVHVVIHVSYVFDVGTLTYLWLSFN